MPPRPRPWPGSPLRTSGLVAPSRPCRPGPRLHARFVELLAAPISTSCRVAGGRVFTLERGGGEAQFRLIVRSATDPTAPAATLIDPAALLEDSTAALDWYYPSPDGHLVAFGVSIGGDERSTLRIVDVETGELLADTIPDTRWSSVAWTPDAAAFAYTRYPSGQEYGERVWWHVVGDHHGHDELVFGDLPIEESMQSITLSRDGRWLAVHCNVGWSRADVHLIDRQTGVRTTLIEGVEAQTFVRVVDDRLIGVTNLDAPRGRVFTASVDAPDERCVADARAAERARHRRRRRRGRGRSSARARHEVGACSGAVVRARRHRHARDRAARSGLARGLRRGRGADAGVPPARVVRAPRDPASLDARARHRAVGHLVVPGRRGSLPCRAGQVPVDRRRRRADVPRPPRRRHALTRHAVLAHWVRRLLDRGDAGVLADRDRGRGGRRHVRRRVHPRRRRGRRGLASRRHARAQTAGVRRLPRRGRLARVERAHVACPARAAGWIERRAADGRGDDAATRSRTGHPLRGPAARHGALPPPPHREAVDSRVRRSRCRRGARVGAGVLAVPPRRARHVLSRRALHRGRGRRRASTRTTPAR